MLSLLYLLRFSKKGIYIFEGLFLDALERKSGGKLRIVTKEDFREPAGVPQSRALPEIDFSFNFHAQ